MHGGEEELGEIDLSPCTKYMDATAVRTSPVLICTAYIYVIIFIYL